MRVGLIGLGMVADTFVDAMANSDRVELAVVHARTAKSRAAFLERNPGSGALSATSLDELIAAKPDFVCLATPPNARKDNVAALVAAGIPILMEKPVERTLEQATELVEYCETHEAPLGIVLQHRFRPVVAAAREAVATLGPLQLVQCDVGWWRPQSYYDELGRGTYERDGGGVMISQAIHIMDLMLSFTGPVADVTATVTTTGLHQMESEDFVSAGLRFQNGAVGHLFATTASFPGRGEAITMHYRDGSVRLERGALQVDRHDGTSETYGQETGSGSGADPMAFSSDAHRFVIEDFADALREGRPPKVTGRMALGVHRLIAAVEEAGRTGARATVPSS